MRSSSRHTARLPGCPSWHESHAVSGAAATALSLWQMSWQLATENEPSAAELSLDFDAGELDESFFDEFEAAPVLKHGNSNPAAAAADGTNKARAEGRRGWPPAVNGLGCRPSMTVIDRSGSSSFGAQHNQSVFCRGRWVLCLG